MPPRNPTKKAEEHALARYLAMPVAKRYTEAIKLVDSGDYSQSEAARRVGISRSKLNQKLKARERKFEEQAQRSEGFLEEVAAITPPVERSSSEPEPSVEVSDPAPESPPATQPLISEERRVPPFKEFMRMYFSDVKCPDCGRHHEVPKLHDDMADKLVDPEAKRLLINVAPYHAKSTIATVYHSLYEICRNPNTRIGIVSKSERLAKRFVRQIADRLTNPELYSGPNLVHDWGPFHNPNSWSSSEFWVAGRTTAEKDPTVSAYGVGAQIYGYRFDIIKFDDIADLENQKNPDRVQEMLGWAIQEAGSRVGRNGKLQFVGTRISAGDIYSHLQELPGFKVFRFPCITDEEAQTTIWQDHFDFEAAALQRSSMKLEQFQLVYQNVDTPGVGASFTPEMLEKSKDSSRALGQYEAGWRLIAGVDPAGSGEQSGYSAMVLLGVDMMTGARCLVDLVNVKQMKAPQMMDQIYDWSERYPLSEVRVEVNGLQRQLFQNNYELNQRLTNRGIRLVPHVTGGRNKWDPQFGVEAMATLFHNELITLPWGDVNSRAKVQQLMDQLIQFPMGSVSDLVMAMWFAEIGCREMFRSASLPAFDPRVKVPGRVAARRRIVSFGEGIKAPTPAQSAGLKPGQSMEGQQPINVSSGVWSH